MSPVKVFAGSIPHRRGCPFAIRTVRTQLRCLGFGRFLRTCRKRISLSGRISRRCCERLTRRHRRGKSRWLRQFSVLRQGGALGMIEPARIAPRTSPTTVELGLEICALHFLSLLSRRWPGNVGRRGRFAFTSLLEIALNPDVR